MLIRYFDYQLDLLRSKTFVFSQKPVFPSTDLYWDLSKVELAKLAHILRKSKSVIRKNGTLNDDDLTSALASFFNVNISDVSSRTKDARAKIKKRGVEGCAFFAFYKQTHM